MLILNAYDYSICLFLADIIVLSSDSEDINEGPSKGKVPKEDINEGPSKGKLAPLGSSARPRPEVSPELAKLFKYGPPPDLLCWYGYADVDEYIEDPFFDSLEKRPKTRGAYKNILSYEDTIKKYVPVVKSASKKAIYKIPQPIIGVVLGLANLKTWDDIVQKIGKRPPGNSADKGKGKAKV
ncbi:hypothetical protein Tco_0879482 [Tanacetum coccineum]